MQEIDKIRNRLLDGDIYGSIESLIAIAISRNLNSINRLYLIKSRQKRNIDQFYSKTINRDDHNIETNQITNSLLHTIDEIKNHLKEDDVISQSFNYQEHDLSTLEKIINGNTFNDVNWLEKGINCSKNVCRISVPNKGYGTGFILKEYILITNNHVLESKDDASNAFAEFNYELNHEHLLKEPIKVSFLPNQFFSTSKELDITILAIDTPIINTINLEIANVDCNTGDYVSIIQHPSGGPKKVVTNSSRIVNFYGDLFHYSTDTLPGSSGSPIFDRNWKLVGVHHAGGNMVIDHNKNKMFINEGILISPIRNHFKI